MVSPCINGQQWGGGWVGCRGYQQGGVVVELVGISLCWLWLEPNQTKANIRIYQPTQQLPPLAGTPLHPTQPPPHCCPFMQGDTIFFLQLFLLVSICIHLPTSPSLYLHVDLQQHHLGKFLYNILLD